MENQEDDMMTKWEGARMRSRWFFVARSTLLALAAVILFAAPLYLVSFIIFVLGRNGVSLAPDFGWSGWLLFLERLPWVLLLLALVLILLLATLLHHYEFIYHRPVVYGLASFAFLIVVASFFIAATSFHQQLFLYSTKNLPWMGQFYEAESAFPPDIHRGQILTVGSDTIIIADDADGITSTVIVPPGSPFPDGFRVGDDIIVFGGRDALGEIAAFGLRRVPMP